MERLWTPWRRAYVGGEQQPRDRLFERLLADGKDAEHFILFRGELVFALMNLFPYNTGHLLIVPNRRVADPTELTPGEWHELTALLGYFTRMLRQVLRADGFNVGLNIGAAAGAGIPDHLHIHIVPRWLGDTNFMPVLGATKVMPELLEATYAQLRAAIVSNPPVLSLLPPLAGAAASSGQPDARPAGVVPPPAADSTPPVAQAGAVVLLRGLVALRRAADGSWVLPKGHLEAGETPAQAAVREVAEEMALAGELGQHLGTLEFVQADRPRQVDYFLFLAHERLDAWDDHVGHDTFLFEPDKAVERLTHADARSVLQAGLRVAGLLE